jgi:hypothetical protein
MPEALGLILSITENKKRKVYVLLSAQRWCKKNINPTKQQP